MAKKTTSNFNFEQAFTELNKIVEVMERGDLSLEDSLKHFEKGIQLTRECQHVLKQAEQKVQVLMQQNNEMQLVDYEAEDR